jgi:N-acetylglucosaminyldiphosphoundecaprenol N-acetyl-beta-D-mannosaminyltransferase
MVAVDSRTALSEASEATRQRFESRRILGMRVDGIEFEPALALVHSWFPDRRARVVCAANVHMVMEAWDDPRFQSLVNAADLVLADGQPMVWALRLLGVPQRRRARVSPDFLLATLRKASESGAAVGLYGGTAETLDAVSLSLQAQFPALKLRYAYAPPFRPLTQSEDGDVVRGIGEAGVELLLVGIGCPKQERWMADHADSLDCVMMGVGAAVDLLAGTTREAPRWTRNIGLEWTYRLLLEPRRLWPRYARANPRFVWLFGMQLVERWRSQRSV